MQNKRTLIQSKYTPRSHLLTSIADILEPLRKREEFAESLRKKKRNDQINKKRRKLTDSKKKLLVEAAA